jgi:iron(III) transport system permease protein
VGLSFIFAFAGPPFMLGGTLLILGLAYFVAFVPLAIVTVEGSVAQVDRSLEEASWVSGARDGRTFLRVLFPIAVPGFFAAWAMVYVRTASDLPMAALLTGIQNPMPGAILLDTHEQGSFGNVAALTLILLAITVPVVLGLLAFGRPRWRRVAKTTRKENADEKH